MEKINTLKGYGYVVPVGSVGGSDYFFEALNNVLGNIYSDIHQMARNATFGSWMHEDNVVLAKLDGEEIDELGGVLVVIGEEYEDGDVQNIMEDFMSELDISQDEWLGNVEIKYLD